jgi:hypothetical protein
MLDQPLVFTGTAKLQLTDPSTLLCEVTSESVIAFQLAISTLISRVEQADDAELSRMAERIKKKRRPQPEEFTHAPHDTSRFPKAERRKN